jgi:hypothetical protein
VIVRFVRVGGWQPPPDSESLEVDDDGTFRMWRSVGSPMAGRFGGKLEPDQLAQLRSEVQRAASGGNLNPDIPPDAAVETVEAGGARAVLGSNDPGSDAWGPLLAHLRRLLGELMTSPVSAVALELDGVDSARLEHRGREPLGLDLSALNVRAVLWAPGYEMLDDWSAPAVIPGDARIQAGPGWKQALPFEHGFRPRPGQVVHAYATVAVLNGEQPVPVSCVVAPVVQG